MSVGPDFPYDNTQCDWPKCECKAFAKCALSKEDKLWIEENPGKFDGIEDRVRDARFILAYKSRWIL